MRDDEQKKDPNSKCEQCKSTFSINSICSTCGPTNINTSQPLQNMNNANSNMNQAELNQSQIDVSGSVKTSDSKNDGNSVNINTASPNTENNHIGEMTSDCNKDSRSLQEDEFLNGSEYVFVNNEGTPKNKSYDSKLHEKNTLSVLGKIFNGGSKTIYSNESLKCVDLNDVRFRQIKSQDSENSAHEDQSYNVTSLKQPKQPIQATNDKSSLSKNLIKSDTGPGSCLPEKNNDMDGISAKSINSKQTPNDQEEVNKGGSTSERQAETSKATADQTAYKNESSQNRVSFLQRLENESITRSSSNKEDGNVASCHKSTEKPIDDNNPGKYTPSRSEKTSQNSTPHSSVTVNQNRDIRNPSTTPCNTPLSTFGPRGSTRTFPPQTMNTRKNDRLVRSEKSFDWDDDLQPCNILTPEIENNASDKQSSIPENASLQSSFTDRASALHDQRPTPERQSLTNALYVNKGQNIHSSVFDANSVSGSTTLGKKSDMISTTVLDEYLGFDKIERQKSTGKESPYVGSTVSAPKCAVCNSIKIPISNMPGESDLCSECQTRNTNSEVTDQTRSAVIANNAPQTKFDSVDEIKKCLRDKNMENYNESLKDENDKHGSTTINALNENIPGINGSTLQSRLEKYNLLARGEISDPGIACTNHSSRKTLQDSGTKTGTTQSQYKPAYPSLGSKNAELKGSPQQPNKLEASTQCSINNSSNLKTNPSNRQMSNIFDLNSKKDKSKDLTQDYRIQTQISNESKTDTLPSTKNNQEAIPKIGSLQNANPTIQATDDDEHKTTLHKVPSQPTNTSSKDVKNTNRQLSENTERAKVEKSNLLSNQANKQSSDKVKAYDNKLLQELSDIVSKIGASRLENDTSSISDTVRSELINQNGFTRLGFVNQLTGNFEVPEEDQSEHFPINLEMRNHRIENRNIVSTIPEEETLSHLIESPNDIDSTTGAKRGKVKKLIGFFESINKKEKE